MKRRKVKIRYQRIFLLVLFLLSLLFFLWIFLSYRKDMEEKNEVNKILTDLSLEDFIHHQKEEKNEIQEEKKIFKDFMEVEMDVLLSKNRDTKGYIKIEGISFSYPFVSEKKGFYQNHSYYQKENQIGWLYIDERANLHTFENMIMYADGKHAEMYFSLAKTLDKSWDKDANFIFLSTKENNSIWKPFHVCKEKISLLQEKNDFSCSKNEISSAQKIDANDIILTIITRHLKEEMVIMKAKLVRKMEREEV